MCACYAYTPELTWDPVNTKQAAVCARPGRRWMYIGWRPPSGFGVVAVCDAAALDYGVGGYEVAMGCLWGGCGVAMRWL